MKTSRRCPEFLKQLSEQMVGREQEKEAICKHIVDMQQDNQYLSSVKYIKEKLS